MIERSKAYEAAITGDARRMYMRAVVDITDPDITFGMVTGSGQAPWSKPQQVLDKVYPLETRYATLEPGRWLLDGGFYHIPENPAELSGELGFVGDAVAGEGGYFASPVWMEVDFENVSILQAFTIYFPDNDLDGYPMDYKVEVYQGGNAVFSRDYTDNEDKKVVISGFNVANPEKIRLTVTRWSIPGRRLRIPEIIPGIIEEWDEHLIASFDLVQQADISCLSLPYGTCTLRMDNQDRRFEPRNKSGIFKSIEERQGIDISVGVLLPDGTKEWKSAGVYYQSGGGWKTSDNDLTMQWNLVDIVGLVTNRTFLPPNTLPTTLSGWVSSIVSHLGENFADRYHVDPDYADLPVTANSAAEVSGKKCGEILRFACMATGTWPRADSETGYLAVEPVWSEGGKLDLDNLTAYPVMKANSEAGNVIFTLADGNETKYTILGTSVSAGSSVNVDNPFIHDATEALAAAKLILSTYGGNRLETTGRGDPSSEIGDVDTVWLDDSNATTGRRIYQTYGFSDGVLSNCRSTLLQADGSSLFENRAVITESCVWTAPSGVTRLHVVIGQGGQGGSRGLDGYLRMVDNTIEAGEGEPGIPGSGGKVWFETFDINDGQSFTVVIGAGGAASDTYGIPGEYGEETQFGVYSSASGKVYESGFTDINHGDSFCRTGVSVPKNGTGDGGAGGKGGRAGVGTIVAAENEDGEEYYYLRTKVRPGKGAAGSAGASGFVCVYWEVSE